MSTDYEEQIRRIRAAQRDRAEKAVMSDLAANGFACAAGVDPCPCAVATLMAASEQDEKLRTALAELARLAEAGTGYSQQTVDAITKEREELREGDACYRWLVAHWARVVTDTCWNGVDEPRAVKSIELGPEMLGSVDPKSLHRAILRAMADDKARSDER